MYNSYNGQDDVMDSREILERIEELTAEFIDATETDPADVMTADDWAFGLTSHDTEELAALVEFTEENDGRYGDSFKDGVIFYHEDYFTEAMKELCSDIGVLPRETPSWIVIDWDETASNMQVDYTEATFRGSEYWAR